MNKFKIGDKVQFTLEMAIKTDVQELGDPLNDIFEVIGVPHEDDKIGHVNGYTLKSFNPKAGMVFGAKDDQLILAGDNPRHIEKTKVKRPSKDEYYLAIAEQVSKRSTCLRRQYGAVIVRDDVIVSTGYNGSPRGEKNCCDKGYCVRQLMNMAHNSGSYDECHSAHAEQNAIINAARQGSSVLGGTLYLYGYDCVEKKTIDATPCPICGRMIKNAGIARIVKSKSDEGVSHDKT